jgi:hypothetical protein
MARATSIWFIAMNSCFPTVFIEGLLRIRQEKAAQLQRGCTKARKVGMSAHIGFASSGKYLGNAKSSGVVMLVRLRSSAKHISYAVFFDVLLKLKTDKRLR